jgi:hypothetical protein
MSENKSNHAGEPAILEKIEVRIDLERHGLPVETFVIGYEGMVDRPELAQRIAANLELEAEDILRELSNPECLDPEHHRGRLKLTCIDLHFETDSRRHHFLPSAKWERVHRWGCKTFKIATSACTNLEMHTGSPEGPELNESKPVGNSASCMEVWLVKPGPEKYGRS